jgi:hypothetical protein
MTKQGAGAAIRARSNPVPVNIARKLCAGQRTSTLMKDGRIFIELINGACLIEHRGTPAEYGAGLKLAIRTRLALAAR